MVSFDLSSLFTNAPLDDLMKFLKYHLRNNNLDIPFNCDVLLKLVKLCTDNCYFSSNGQFVSQIRVLPMGGPLSPVLCNIYMEYFEKHLLSSIVDFEIIGMV